MKKCIFCKLKTSSIKVNNFKNINKKGYFYNCSHCKIDFNPKPFNEKKYSVNKNINYFGHKNFIYYLKSLFLLIYYIKIKKYFSNFKKINILDFGSGSGELTNLLILSGNKIFATDYAFNKKFYSKEIIFIDIKKMFVKKFYGKFDIIILRHVLEHISNLKVFFKKISILMKNKNAKIIIEVPNYNSFWKKILKNRWPGYFYPYHHYVFSENFLEKEIKKNGFTILKKSKVENSIIGSYFYTFGINRSICKLIAIFLYPLQLAVSKLLFSSEALFLVLKKND